MVGLSLGSLRRRPFLHRVGRTADVGEGLTYVGPSMRGTGRMCLDSYVNARYL